MRARRRFVLRRRRVRHAQLAQVSRDARATSASHELIAVRPDDNVDRGLILAGGKVRGPFVGAARCVVFIGPVDWLVAAAGTTLHVCNNCVDCLIGKSELTDLTIQSRISCRRATFHSSNCA